MSPLAVVTGGTRGIGAGISRHLCRRGYRVAAIHRANVQAAKEFEQSVTDAEGALSIHQADLTDVSEVATLTGTIIDLYGAPTLLVNNAGAIPRPAYWRDQLIGDAHATVLANLGLTLNVIWSFVPHMIGHGSGSVVNISSIYASLGEPYVLAYTAAKSGLHTMTRGLARDLGRSGITVNTISPAVVRTDMTEAAGEEFIAEQRDRTPTRDLATADDIARCVEFLAANRAINGVDIAVDGGLHLMGP